MVMTRHEFLAAAHAILCPRVYLEVGVQTGASLALAEAAEKAIGVDPAPAVTSQFQRSNQIIVTATADDYFAPLPSGTTFVPLPKIDFAFIDGSHLFEDALRDFINLRPHMNGHRAVIVFDDVLPYSQAIATREQPPGDWTGDVWKVVEILAMREAKSRRGLLLTLIDTWPTGLLMVQATDWKDGSLDYEKLRTEWLDYGEVVPDHVLSRSLAISGEEALDILRGVNT